MIYPTPPNTLCLFALFPCALGDLERYGPCSLRSDYVDESWRTVASSSKPALTLVCTRRFLSGAFTDPWLATCNCAYSRERPQVHESVICAWMLERHANDVHAISPFLHWSASITFLVTNHETDICLGITVSYCKLWLADKVLTLLILYISVGHGVESTVLYGYLDGEARGDPGGELACTQCTQRPPPHNPNMESPLVQTSSAMIHPSLLDREETTYR